MNISETETKWSKTKMNVESGNIFHLTKFLWRISDYINRVFFSYNSRYSLVLYPNLTGGSFLKVIAMRYLELYQ